MRLSLNMIGNYDDETKFPHKLLLTNRQVWNPHKGFGNIPSANIKLSNTQISKMMHLGGFLGRCHGPLLKRRNAIHEKSN